MNTDAKNLVLAIALSLLVIVGWNYFYGVPQIDKAKQTTADLQSPTVPPQPGGAPVAAATDSPNPGLSPLPGESATPVVATRAQALAESPRIPIDTPSLFGSISLRGARIDDVSFKKYRDTPDPDSSNVVLLSPVGAPNAYYSDIGFVASSPSSPPLPNADTLWVADGTKLTQQTPLTLTYDDGKGLVFHRTISVDDNYMFTVKDSVENKTSAPVDLSSYARVVRVGTPKVSGYSVLFEGMTGLIGDSGNVEISYANIEKEPHATRILKGTGGWLGFTDKYWSAVVIPDQTVPSTAYFSSTGATDKTYQMAVSSDATTVAPGASLQATNRVFAGAKVSQLIDTYQASLGIKRFDLMIDWGWFYFITKPLSHLIDFIYRLVGNFGLAIMIVTVLVKICFFPIANRSYRSMAKMKAVQPQMAALKERYPDDKKKQQSELMELYKKEKINPIAGCLPVLLQIPVFFALYKVIFITIEMRQAPFFGWITDLSAPDPTNLFTLFGLLHYDPTQVPVIGHFLSLGILPIAMGLSMFVQMKLNPAPADPVQKQMFTWMPVIWAFMMGSFPAGLLVYWTWSNIFSICQQSVIMHRAGVKIELWNNLLEAFGRKKKSTAVGSRP